MPMVRHWITALRLRTLPLGVASIAMSGILAYADGQFKVLIFCMTLLTTVLLQILSNLANDYGDSVNGADNEFREGPERQTQIAAISVEQMKLAITLMIGLTLVSGITLLYISGLTLQVIGLFLIAGIICIGAAIKYTAGDSPYGYAGLGDLSVLIFFGWVGILGAYYLHSLAFEWHYILPATSCGLFMVAVLNVNNIRDIYSDEKAGKYSIPVRLGRRKAVWYHWALLTLGLGLSILFVCLDFRQYHQFLFLLIVPLLIINGKSVKHKTEAMQLDPYLKQMVLTTILYVITFGAGHLISHI